MSGDLASKHQRGGPDIKGRRIEAETRGRRGCRLLESSVTIC